MIIEGTVLVCASKKVIKEYIDVINRNKFKKYRNFYTKAEILLGYIEEIAEKYSPKKTIDKLQDKSDNKFLELAIESEADFLITGNLNDFDIREIGVTKIVSPTEYWNNFKPK